MIVTHRRSLAAIAAITALAFAASCASDSESADTADASTSEVLSSTTEVATTVAETTTTAAAAAPTTLPATTVPAVPSTLPAGSLALRSGGIGPFDFGTAASASVIDAIVVGIGAPVSNDLTLYPDADPVNGLYYTADGTSYLDNPVGRTTCWGRYFCVDFSGATDVSLHMIGWWYTGPRRLMFSTASLTIGDTWSDFPHMEVHPGCYEGEGSHQGIYVRLQTDAPWQWTVDNAGIVPNLPDPTLAKVIWMSAGEGPVGTEGADC